MLTKEQIKERLEDRSATYIAKKIGLTFSTVNNAKKGVVKPSYRTIAKLSEYLEKPYKT